MIKCGIISLLINIAAWVTFDDSETLKVNVPKVVMLSGGESVVSVYVDVNPGYHIQSNKVKNEFLIPTKLEVIGTKEIIPGRQVFPATKKYKLEGTDSFLDVLDGTFEIKAFLKTQRTIQKGKYTLRGMLKYQACDSSRCYFPKSQGFSIDVEVN